MAYIHYRTTYNMAIISDIKEGYHKFPKYYIGDSEIASLIMVGCKKDSGATSEMLDFVEDGDYHAYIIDEPCEIPEHYHLVSEFEAWLKIYDDNGLTFHAYAPKIKVYRAGDYGCIIHLLEN